MNSRVILALAISAGMALLVTGIFYQVAIRGGADSSAVVTLQEVAVATRDLNIGAAIQPADIKMEPWPSDRIPEGAFTEIEPLIERVAINRVLAGEPVLDRRLAPPGSGLGLAPKVPEGMRAISVRVDDVTSLSGFVLPEARVDVLVTAAPRDRPDAGTITKTILGNVRVLSAGEHLEPDASGKPQPVRVVTLLVTPEQAEILTLSATKGKLQLVLRNMADDEVAETSGALENEIFAAVQTRPPNVSLPRPPARVVRVEPPPPPPPIEVEMIRGEKRTVQAFPNGSE